MSGPRQANFWDNRWVKGDPKILRHGHAVRPKSTEYRAWENVVQKECAVEWVESFDRFLADMGRRPHPQLGRTFTLQRIDPEKPWGPGNVEWRTRGKNPVCIARGPA